MLQLLLRKQGKNILQIPTNPMNGKELILRSLQNQTVLRPAWIPFVGVHGGKLTELSAEEYLQSSDALVEK